MTIDLNVLDHLGINLYSSTPAVISEVVANGYDADATRVSINISTDTDQITISDNGIGMNVDDINNKYLRVGYKRRETEARSSKYDRPVMGRKGLGKLSLLSIANRIELHTKKEGTDGQAFVISLEELHRTIREKKEIYVPQEIVFNQECIDGEHGTTIIISDFRQSIDRTASYLRPRVAKRFSLLSTEENPFQIYLNDTLISISDRGYLDKLEFVWCTEDYKDRIPESIKGLQKNTFESGLGDDYKISGWIGTVVKPSQLQADGVNNNQISIIVRGKLAQEDILSSYAESGFYANYMIGEIHADFLDEDDKQDIATSNRQQINENDDRFRKLKNHLYTILKQIQREWTDLRKKQDVSRATREFPILREWFEALGSDDKKTAEGIFHAIEKAEFETIGKKKEVYKYGILAFERLKIRNNLSAIQNLQDKSVLESIGTILKEVKDVEESLYYDIIKQRLQVVQKLCQYCDTNDLEKIIQDHIFQNLWLLEPSWDSPAPNTGRLEQQIKKEFDAISEAIDAALPANLTPEERKGRVDIRYQTVAGKHVIIELKRYSISYPYTKNDAQEQLEKYISALKKCLQAVGDQNPIIEAILIVGPKTFTEDEFIKLNMHLALEGARAITYDSLIRSAEEKYKAFTQIHRDSDRIRAIIEEL